MDPFLQGVFIGMAIMFGLMGVLFEWAWRSSGLGDR
jgi:hypothetical protein